MVKILIELSIINYFVQLSPYSRHSLALLKPCNVDIPNGLNVMRLKHNEVHLLLLMQLNISEPCKRNRVS